MQVRFWGIVKPIRRRSSFATLSGLSSNKTALPLPLPMPPAFLYKQKGGWFCHICPLPDKVRKGILSTRAFAASYPGQTSLFMLVVRFASNQTHFRPARQNNVIQRDLNFASMDSLPFTNPLRNPPPCFAAPPDGRHGACHVHKTATLARSLPCPRQFRTLFCLSCSRPF